VERRLLRARVVACGFVCSAALICTAAYVYGREGPVTVQARIAKASSETKSGGRKPEGLANVVVWLTPQDRAGNAATGQRKRVQLVQKDKSFEPHILVVRSGDTVDFPNRDPFFHNVFSLFDGKRFDLGLYEAGATNSARFDRAGVSFLFCNIHPEMSAVIVSVDTPYYGISDRGGRITIGDVADGRYEMHVWYERSLADELKGLTRSLTISGSARTLEPIEIVENAAFSSAHKNKYGQEYATPPSAPYSRP
jgi:plastocyanin